MPKPTPAPTPADPLRLLAEAPLTHWRYRGAANPDLIAALLLAAATINRLAPDGARRGSVVGTLDVIAAALAKAGLTTTTPTR